MELLYVWIENFRNIKKKGFNFSNKIDITYYETSNSLIVKNVDGSNALTVVNESLRFIDKTHYLDDFFHPQISNISAIIGKNSSGKSNIIDFIVTAISSGNRNRLISNYVLIFKKHDEPVFFGKTSGNSLNVSDISCMGLKLSKIPPERELESIFYSNVADSKEYIFEGSSVYNFSFAALNKLQSNKIRFVNSSAFKDTWSKLNPNSSPDKKVRFVFNPIAFIELESGAFEKGDKITGILKRYRKAIYHESTSNYNRFKYALTINLFSFLVINKKNFDKGLQSIQLVAGEDIAETIASLHPKIVNFLAEFDEILDLPGLPESSYTKYMELLLELQQNSYDFGIIDSYSHSIMVDFNDEFKRIIEGKYDIFNNQDLVSHDWSQLSSGMRAYLNLFAQLYYLSEKTEDSSKALFICIDEGDLYLHPEWQRNFLNDFIEFISRIFDKIRIQVILTSHSPFLISDLPKENVLLLDDDCNPNRQLSEASSFGANIHQLYTKQFFLEDGGSIGEFARNKIRTLAADIRNMTNDNVDTFQCRIAMIGEPILRIRLEDEFKARLKTLSPETQIKWHQQEIRKLQLP